MFSNNLQFKVNTIETGWFPLEHIRASSAHVFLINVHDRDKTHFYILR